MADGWCRTCDGFGRPEAAQPKKEEPRLNQVTRWQETDARPLESDEAFDEAFDVLSPRHRQQGWCGPWGAEG